MLFRVEIDSDRQEVSYDRRNDEPHLDGRPAPDGALVLAGNVVKCNHLVKSLASARTPNGWPRSRVMGWKMTDE